MTEKALPDYGYSLFEFQIYGANGVVERPVDYGVNLALNKPVKSKSNTVKSGDTTKEVNTRDEWWMYDKAVSYTHLDVYKRQERLLLKTAL